MNVFPLRSSLKQLQQRTQFQLLQDQQELSQLPRLWKQTPQLLKSVSSSC